ncbi:MAG: hypothetical protein ACRDTD_05700 [Pseudonocardiaceae bacterium]
MELATGDEIEKIGLRATREGKKLVFTAHDLVPNIETDRAVFDHKTMLAERHAAAVITLTGMAAQHLASRVGRDASPVRVVSHGAALPLPFVGGGSKGEGVAVFGALRPNRDLMGLVRAWRILPQTRPALRMLVRSVTKAERQRYAAVLADLDEVRNTEPGFTITTTTEMVAPGELASWCQQSAVLALPYRWVTHSGQLELARDLGLRALAPDVPTLRAQIADVPRCEAVWFPPQTLDEPQRLAGYLRHALSLPPPTADNQTLRTCRAAEHLRFLDAHRELYFGSLQRRCEVDVRAPR